MTTNQPMRYSVKKFMDEHSEAPVKEVVDHYVGIGCKQSSVYRWIKSIQQTGNSTRKRSSGRPVKIATKKNIRALKNYFNHRSARSQNAFAKRIGCTQRYVGYMLQKHTDIRRYKKAKRPLMTAAQRKKARPKCRAMYDRYKKQDFVIDDESYFPLGHNDLPGNDSYYSDNRDETSDRVKYDIKQSSPQSFSFG